MSNNIERKMEEQSGWLEELIVSTLTQFYFEEGL